MHFRSRVEAAGWRCRSELEVLGQTRAELAVYGLAGVMVRGGDRYSENTHLLCRRN